MFVLGTSLLLIIIWLVLDFSLGRRQHLLNVRFPESPRVYGQFEIFVHGKELFDDYFDALRSAEKQIHILFYIVKDDAFCREFFSILKDKAREGVEVCLLLDRLGSLKVKKSIAADLRHAGVEVAFSDRVKLPFLFYSTQVRNHRKISVIDGKIGYLGGFNVGKEYIDEGPGKLRPWRDYHLKMTGEGVEFLQKEFLLDWRQAANGRGLQSESLLRWQQPITAVTGMETSAELTIFPEQVQVLDGICHQLIPTEANQLEERFIQLIQLAEREILIGSPYFIPSRRIMEELLAAIKRRVKLTIVVPFSADHLLVQEASYRYFRRLLHEGALVYQYKNGFYHAKTLVIDDKVCDIGTANFDKRSLYLNKEINCYIYDSNFITRLKTIIAKDIRDSEPLTLKDLNQPNLLRTIKEGAAYCISYFL